MLEPTRRGRFADIGDWQRQYAALLTTAEEAAAWVRDGDVLVMSASANWPYAFDAALTKHLRAIGGRVEVNGLFLPLDTCLMAAENKDLVTFHSNFFSGERVLAPQGNIQFVPTHLSATGDWQASRHPRVAVITCSAPNEQGWMSRSLWGSDVSRQALEQAEVVIVEVNEKMPRCLGGFDNCIHVSEVDMIVEGRNDPMGIQPSNPATEVDKAVAKLIVEQIPNGACLQLGIGGMPNTVGAMLCESDLKDLGVHTEMYVDAYVDLALAGKVTGMRKNLDRGRQVYAFAAGTQKLYDYLDDNPACMAAPISYTNDIRTVASLDNFVSINNAVDVDLYGQVNGETAGIKQISGAGGQQDFVLGAYLSKGGKSFICLSSTHKNKDGTLASRIRPTLQPGSVVTDTRVNTMYVVTEYGCVCLKGLSVWERAEKLISIAHPDFREELIKEAEKQKIWYPHNRR